MAATMAKGVGEEKVTGVKQPYKKPIDGVIYSANPRMIHETLAQNVFHTRETTRGLFARGAKLFTAWPPSKPPQALGQCRHGMHVAQPSVEHQEAPKFGRAILKACHMAPNNIFDDVPLNIAVNRR